MGVMDLRGETTKIIDPKQVFDVESGSDGERIIIFDNEGNESVGWQVDSVHEVRLVDEESIDSMSDDSQSIKGVVQRDDGFVVIVEPTDINTPSEMEVQSPTPA